MGFIYKIVNDINEKIYIGKTTQTIEKRFKEHCRDAFKQNNEIRPLYNAMKKYGINHFSIEKIGQYPDEELSKWEQYWIGYYKGYEEGYNATRGGEGTLIYDHLKILNRLKENPYPVLVAKEFGCCVDIVNNLVKNNHIQIKNYGQELLKKTSKPIAAFDKKNNFIKNFNSTQEAAEWCFLQKKCLSLNSGVRSHIAECANGKRKTAYTYIWKYL